MKDQELLRLIRSITRAVTRRHDEDSLNASETRIALADLATLYNLDNQDFATLVRANNGEAIDR